MDIVLLTDGRRSQLYDQTFKSLLENSLYEHHIWVVTDGVGGEWKGVGGSKNRGASEIQRTNKFLLFSDDDMYYLPKWDLQIHDAMEDAPDITQMGVWSHPFNVVTKIPNLRSAGSVNACHGGGFVIRWADWDKYGPFPDNAVGPGQSEDWALSQRIVKGGGKLGCVVPFAAIHCGLTNCLGSPATGYDHLKRAAEMQLKEYGLEGEVIVR